MHTLRTRRLGRSHEWPEFDKRPSKGSRSALPPPILTAATDGTPTADGAIAAGVTTDQGSGVLYWAVVTNAGSCSDAQLKAGAGGDIVADKAGNQTVAFDPVTPKALTIATIEGLTGTTTYQIKFLHSNSDGADSAQASVDLTTL